jgi:hypothetical protein
MTRSRTVSSSRALGSVVMVSSAAGRSPRIARVSCCLMVVTRSSGSVRLMLTVSSTNNTAPAGRTRTRSTATTPGIWQRVDRAAAETVASNADKYSDHERRGGIGPGMAERDPKQSDQNGDRRPHIGAKMQRIGFQRFASGGLRDPLEPSRAKKIDHNRSDNDGKSRNRGLDRVRLRADESPHRFKHHNRGQQE